MSAFADNNGITMGGGEQVLRRVGVKGSRWVRLRCAREKRSVPGLHPVEPIGRKPTSWSRGIRGGTG